MSEITKSKTGLKSDVEELIFAGSLSNPLSDKTNVNLEWLSNYTQEVKRPKYDHDLSEILEIVRILNNMAPVSMPEYNFVTDEINGERYKRPDGTLLLIREYDGDIIRDYYVSPEDISKIAYIKEHDKNTGRLRARIELLSSSKSRLKTSITIFDAKINNKYTIIQLTDGGIVGNITEFSGKGKSFRTLFRNVSNSKPARYLEGKDDKENGFEMIDCLFGNDGQIVRIKRYNKRKEINIDYTERTKTVSVKTKTE